MTDDLNARGGVMRLPRSRGALSGLLLLALGAWGALIPFIGPYFDFAYSPDQTWNWTQGRFFFEVAPGVVTAIGGLLLLVSANRAMTSLGAWLAVASGGWFVVGPTVQGLVGLGRTGVPVSSGKTEAALETLTFFTGLGAVIVLVGGIAVGRLSVRSVRDVKSAMRREARETQAAQEAEAQKAREIEAARTAQAEQDRQAEAERVRTAEAQRAEQARQADGHRVEQVRTDGASPSAEDGAQPRLVGPDTSGNGATASSDVTTPKSRG